MTYILIHQESSSSEVGATPEVSVFSYADLAMNGSSASIASKSTRRSTKSRRGLGRKRVDNADLSEPLTANVSHEDEVGDDQQWDKNGTDIESGQGVTRNGTPLPSSASSIEDADPFHVFREDLSSRLSWCDEALTRYLRVVENTVRFKVSRPARVELHFRRLALVSFRPSAFSVVSLTWIPLLYVSALHHRTRPLTQRKSRRLRST